MRGLRIAWTVHRKLRTDGPHSFNISVAVVTEAGSRRRSRWRQSFNRCARVQRYQRECTAAKAKHSAGCRKLSTIATTSLSYQVMVSTHCL
jgi:hypothetical protein